MKVRVLYGGDSSESVVSLASGESVINILTEAGYDVTPMQVERAEETVNRLTDVVDPVVSALHGGWGEDGRLQAVMELLRIPFVGCGSAACMLAMNKWLSKSLFSRAGLLTPSGTLVCRGGCYDEQANGLAQALERHQRLVIKPNSGGSTIGTTVVERQEDLLPALETAWAQNDDALVEQFIPGREMTVTVWDSPFGVEALPVVEIHPSTGFYDFNAKYQDGGSLYEVPASLPDEMNKKVVDMAVQAYRVLGCRDYARVDLRMTTEGDPYVLEVNTTPGMTAHSLTPMAVTASGSTMGEFFSTLIDRAVQRG